LSDPEPPILTPDEQLNQLYSEIRDLNNQLVGLLKLPVSQTAKSSSISIQVDDLIQEWKFWSSLPEASVGAIANVEIEISRARRSLSHIDTRANNWFEAIQIHSEHVERAEKFAQGGLHSLLFAHGVGVVTCVSVIAAEWANVQIRTVLLEVLELCS